MNLPVCLPQDAEFDLVEVALSEEQRRLYRECSSLFFDLRSAVDRAMTITGERGNNSPMKTFWYASHSGQSPTLLVNVQW